MLQFSLVLETTLRKQEIPPGGEIQPETSEDKLYLVFKTPSTGQCLIRITNGRQLREPIFGEAGSTGADIGLVRDYEPGKFNIYLGRGGFASESVTYRLKPWTAECEKTIQSTIKKEDASVDLPPKEDELLSTGNEYLGDQVVAQHDKKNLVSEKQAALQEEINRECEKTIQSTIKKEDASIDLLPKEDELSSTGNEYLGDQVVAQHDKKNLVSEKQAALQEEINRECEKTIQSTIKKEDASIDLLPKEDELSSTGNKYLGDQVAAQHDKKNLASEKQAALQKEINRGESIEKAIKEQKEENIKAENKRKRLLCEYEKIGLDINDNNASIKTRQAELDGLLLESKKIESKTNDINKRLRESRAELVTKHKELIALNKAHMDTEKSKKELLEIRQKVGMKDREIQEESVKLKISEKELRKIRAKKKKADAKYTEIERQVQNLYDATTDEQNNFNDLTEREKELKKKNQELTTSIENLDTIYSGKIHEFKDKLNAFYHEAGLVDKQSKDVEESFNLIKFAIENDQFAKRIEDLEELKKQIKEIETRLIDVKKEYRKALKRMESIQK